MEPELGWESEELETMVAEYKHTSILNWEKKRGRELAERQIKFEETREKLDIQDLPYALFMRGLGTLIHCTYQSDDKTYSPRLNIALELLRV